MLMGFNQCKQQQIEEDQLPELSSAVSEEPPKVNALILKRRPFYKEILSQGKVQAASRSDIIFPFEGHIDKVLVKVGQKVNRGDVLARLDDYELKHECASIQQEIAQAQLQIETKLVSLGYSKADTSSLAPELWNNIKTESGLPGLKLKLQKAQHQLEQAVIRAPISGLVANVEGQADNPTQNYEKLCTIIDNSRMEVKFPILEAEIGMLRKGNKVSIKPLYDASKSFEAVVSGINPEVDENGIVWGFAAIHSRGGQLLDGMKVNVYIKESMPDQLVLPKSAVVDRQNRLVTFAYKNGQAHWVYAQVVQENADSYALDDSGVQEGDTVIISNNFDLAHLEEVTLDSVINGNIDGL